MAALRRSWQIQKVWRAYLAHSRNLSSSSVLNSEWNFNWKPGPYPTTKEEHDAAAKKYGMTPEDYKPIPPEKGYYGDYPDLPLVGEETKSPWEAWDDPGMMRHYGEPMHLHYEAITADRSDPSRQYRIPVSVMMAMFWGFFFGTFCLFLWSGQYNVYFPMYKRWFPFDENNRLHVNGSPAPSGKRVIHYTFEPAE